VYLRLRKRPRVAFINVTQKLLEILWCTWELLSFAVLCMFRRASLVNPQAQPFNQGFLWYRLVDKLVRRSLIFLLAQRYFKDLHSLRESVSNYDIRRSQLGNPADGAMLLQFINYYWGADAPQRPGHVRVKCSNHGCQNMVTRLWLPYFP
jgi:hypothetical protein